MYFFFFFKKILAKSHSFYYILILRKLIHHIILLDVILREYKKKYDTISAIFIFEISSILIEFDKIFYLKQMNLEKMLSSIPAFVY